MKLDDIESAKPSRQSLWIHPNELLASRICTFLSHLLLSVPSAFMIIVAICAIYYLQDYHDFAIILFFVIGNAALCVFEEEVNAIDVMSESESSTGIYNTSVTPMSEVIEKAADLLPHQPIIANFVHHNPWERFQHKPFFDWTDSAARQVEMHSVTLALLRSARIEAPFLTIGFVGGDTASWMMNPAPMISSIFDTIESDECELIYKNGEPFGPSMVHKPLDETVQSVKPGKMPKFSRP